jgi:hypothetical protein
MAELRLKIIDNFSLGRMSWSQVQRAYGANLRDARERARDYRRAANQIDNRKLEHDWPRKHFINPQLPIGFYYVPYGEDDIVGFLETKVHFRDYAIVRECVMLNANRTHGPALNLDATHVMFRGFVQDCNQQQVNMIILPRALCQRSPQGAQYNFGALQMDGQPTWPAHYLAICQELIRHYRFLHFETPFTSRFVEIETAHQDELETWFYACLDPFPLNRVDRLRVHHYSLWRLDGERLKEYEVDILIEWQRSNNQFRTLPLEFDSHDVPIRIFGQSLQARLYTLEEVMPRVEQVRLIRDMTRFQVGAPVGRPLTANEVDMIRLWQSGRYDNVADLLPLHLDAEGLPHFFGYAAGPATIIQIDVYPREYYLGLDSMRRLRVLQTQRWVVNNERPPNVKEAALIELWQSGSYDGQQRVLRPMQLALEFNDHGVPIRMFGKNLIAQAEDVRRMQIVAYRSLTNVPPELLRAQERNWWRNAPVVLPPAEPVAQQPIAMNLPSVNVQPPPFAPNVNAPPLPRTLNAAQIAAQAASSSGVAT